MPDPLIVRQDICITVPGGIAIAQYLTPRHHIDPAAPLLVFLHEGLGCIGMWKDFPTALAEVTGCAAILYDRPGHGRLGAVASPRGPEYFETEAFDVLPSVLEVVGSIAGISIAPKNMILIGHSDGGTIALLHAGRFPVRGIITEAAHVFVEDISRRGVESAQKIWRDTDFSDRLARYHGENTRAIFEAWSTMWLSAWFRDWSIAPDLPKAKCPVLAMQGDDDEYGTMAQLDAIQRGVAGPVEPFAIPDCGHAPHIQARDAVLSAMVKFIARLPA
ncbi:MAG: alpha/beta hydrolase [Alphaproteobacteria bacterium]|nr:alpha/beta hydrolase [Alphaproteobacteria bacterium]